MFKKLFSGFKKKPKPRAIEPAKKRPAYNHCLFVSGTSSLSTKFGVFYSSFDPGIKDCGNGILYIAPEEYMIKRVGRRPTAYDTRNAILEYYGIEYEYKPNLSHFNDLYFD